MPYCPLGRAFLTGTINENSRFGKVDRRWNLPQFQPEALKHNMPLVALVRKWAERKGVTPAQFAFVWMLPRKAWIAPVPGTTRPVHLDDFLGAANVRLTPYEILNDFNNTTEKIFYPNPALTLDGVPRGCAPVPGDITIYAPWGNVAIFCKEWPYSDDLVKIGHIDGEGIDALDVGGDIRVRIEKP